MTDFKMNCSNFPCQANSAGWCPKCDQPTQGTAMLAAAPQQHLATSDPEGHRQAIIDAEAQQQAEPVAYLCPAGCGCTWRDNRDGSMSLFGHNSRSCATCENLPLSGLIPVYYPPLPTPRITAAQIERIKRLVNRFETSVRMTQPNFHGSKHFVGPDYIEDHMRRAYNELRVCRDALYAALDAMMKEEI